MADSITMRNTGETPVSLRIDGRPGDEPLLIAVAPGDVCDVPAAYVRSGHVARVAPGLKPAENAAPAKKKKAPPAQPEESAPKAKITDEVVETKKKSRGKKS